ncbi:MAG: hypothetical protein H0W82_00460 [Actinobacteria bacterium]|nr:hypothetical protein [Actinomycetota bacterium]
MAVWILVWLVLTVVALVALGAILVGVVREALVLSRSLGRFTDEVGSLAAEIGHETDRVTEHGSPPKPRA